MISRGMAQSVCDKYSKNTSIESTKILESIKKISCIPYATKWGKSIEQGFNKKKIGSANKHNISWVTSLTI